MHSRRARIPQALLQRARQRYFVFTGALTLATAALCLTQQLGPAWLGWGLGGLAALLLFAGRPRA